MMAPLVRRTWAQCGVTPILYQRTRSHEKVSAIAALCVAPTRDRVQLYFRLHPNKNVNADIAIAFLRCLLRKLQAPIVLVWDRLLAHRSLKVKTFIQGEPRLNVFHFPPYAPELNPVEAVWSYLKMNPMANYAAYELDTLTITSRRHARSLQRKPPLLRSFLRQTPLSLRLR